MLVSARVFIAAIGLVLSLGSPALGDPPSAPSHNSHDNASHQEHPATVEGAGGPWSWLSAANSYFGVEGCLPYPVDYLSAADGHSETSRHENCDLKAQEIAANSSRWLLVVTVGQTILAVFGTWLVWRSLKLTRTATAHALDAISVTRDIGERQIRAYLSVADVAGGNIASGSIPYFTLKLINTGSSPAKQCRVMANVFDCEGAPDAAFIRMPKDVVAPSKSNISAGGGVTIHREFGRPITDEDVEDYISGKRQIIFAGFVVYRDVFGKTRRLTFKLNSHRGKVGRADIYFRVCSAGNRET